MTDHLTSQIEKLRNMKRPEDLAHAQMLSDTPVPLRVHSGPTSSETALLEDSKKIYFTKKTFRKNGRGRMWSVDISSSAPGYFDESGNFILDKSDKISTLWFVRKDAAEGSIEGPLTCGEIRKAAEEGHLQGRWVKRSFDKGFVGADGLILAHPTFYHSRNLNKYFTENQVVDEKPSSNSDDFYSDVVTRERSVKLTNFIKSNSITASVDHLVKTIRNMTKHEAVKAIRGITGLGAVENTMLVELLVEDASTQILSDVDKDGFMLNANGKGGRRFARKQ